MIFYTHKGHAEASRADLRTKINVIKSNTHLCPVGTNILFQRCAKSFMVSRSTYYYESKANKDESQLVADIVEIFRRSRNNYRVPVLSEGKVSSFDGQ